MNRNPANTANFDNVRNKLRPNPSNPVPMSGDGRMWIVFRGGECWIPVPLAPPAHQVALLSPRRDAIRLANRDPCF